MCLSTHVSGESSAYLVVLSSLFLFRLSQHWYGACGSLACLSSLHHPHFMPHHPAAVVPLQHSSHPYFAPPALVWCLQISSVPLPSPLLSSPPSFPTAPSSHSGASMVSLSVLNDGIYTYLYATTGPVSPSMAHSAMRPPSLLSCLLSRVHHTTAALPNDAVPPPLTLFATTGPVLPVYTCCMYH